MTLEYIVKIFTVFITAFLPVSEMFIAIPTGFALGLDGVSVWASTVAGNILPIFLIHLLYRQIMRIERVNRWLSRLVSPKAQDRANRYGSWFVLLTTPLTGVWVMGMTTKLVAMDARKVWISALISISLYALVVTTGVFCGVEALMAGV